MHRFGRYHETKILTTPPHFQPEISVGRGYGYTYHTPYHAKGLYIFGFTV